MRPNKQTPNRLAPDSGRNRPQTIEFRRTIAVRTLPRNLPGQGGQRTQVEIVLSTARTIDACRRFHIEQVGINKNWCQIVADTKQGLSRLEFDHFYIDTLRMAEVVPHFGLPVRVIAKSSTRPTKIRGPPGSGGPIPALLGLIFGRSGPGPWMSTSRVQHVQ